MMPTVLVISVLLTVYQEQVTVFNIITLRGFALSYFRDSHISFLLLPRALSNFFCCGVNMEILCKFNYQGLRRFCKQRCIGCVSPPASPLKVDRPLEFLIYSSKNVATSVNHSEWAGRPRSAQTGAAWNTQALFIEVCVFVFWGCVMHSN